ncbi:ABC transporter ATP-binding protein [Marinibactrum halimedae]|uniref:ABC transporter ATP-binding protein n=1 Tax=Marinibactrum halimedae TaxID=1444977 RepID=UPI001E5A5E6B|nr:ABC transporter ATP-binding protein [Marinibactrum halimedae]MCD9461393.1 ABC transporter ATP-binding protein [Marinibactrum halimedae]
MIESITLFFGNKPDSENLHLKPAPINIFVGPNNSGKSLLLKEIEQLCNNPEPNRKIIDRFETKQFSKEEISELLKGTSKNSPTLI